MKKLILTITLAAFTLGAYAGADACCSKEKATACAGADKAACTASTTAGKKCTKCTGKKIVQSPKGAAASKS